jgi:hypothetical protein
MYSIHKTKAAAATLMVGFLLAIAFATTAEAADGTRFGMTPQQWKAQQARGNALNRYYHLGAYSPAAEARRADEIRGQALNRYYHLGRYTVIETSSPFHWSDAGIGAGAMLGTILIAGGLTVALRRRPRRPRGVVVGGMSPGRLQ